MKRHKTYAEVMQERNEPLFDYECSKCGWNALNEDGLEQGYCEVIHSQETDTEWGPGCELHIKCVCPNCNTEFEYFDGYP